MRGLEQQTRKLHAQGKKITVYLLVADAPSADELREWANAQLGKVQRLADLRYVDQLPRSEIGKVLKRQLREQWSVGATAS